MRSTGRARPELRLGWVAVLVAACTTPARSTRTPVESTAVRRAAVAVADDAPRPPEAEASPLAEEPEVAEEPELIEDEAPHEADAASAAAVEARPHPLDGWTSERIARAVRESPDEIGSLSIGQPNAGALMGAVEARPSALFEPVNPAGAFGTEETLEYLAAAIQRVHAQFPNTPPLSLGHISDRNGGPLSPHISHQSGRDVDISFYYVTGARWYARGTRDNLDLPRTWAFVRALVIETDVEMILIDHSIQALLRQHALEIGEDSEWIDSLFRGVKGVLPPLVRHAPGHATHIHVRFYNPIAQESARRCYDALVAAKKLRPLTTYIRHRAKKGDTLGKLAKKYGVSPAAIKAANGIRKTLIRERAEYRIPVRAGAPRPPPAPLRFPSRRLPPERVGQSSPDAVSRARAFDGLSRQ